MSTPRSASARRVWLLEMDLGHVYRFSTEFIDVRTRRNERLRYEEGLADPGVGLSVGAGYGEQSISVELIAEVDIGELLARGVPLEGREALLLRHEEGARYERALVVLRGRITDVSYGAVGEPIQFAIRRSIAAESDTLPPPQAVIDETTWPIAPPTTATPDDSIGAMYPIIIGSPGYNADGGAYPAVQVYYGAQYNLSATDSYIPVGDGIIAASQCVLTVRDEPNPTPLLTTPSTRTVSVQQDLLARDVSVVVPDSSSGQTWREVRFFVGFGAADGSGVTYQNAPVRGAGDVMRWLLATHVRYPTDWTRLDAVRERLNAYKIDAHIVEPTNMWEWFLAEVLPLLPIELRESVDGLYPHMWRWGATKRDVVAWLDATPGTGRVSRVSAIMSDQAEIYNEITLEYGRAPDGDRYRFRKIATSSGRATVKDASPSDDDRIRGSSLLGDSQRVYGLKQLTLQLGAVWDHATAELVLRDKVLAHAWPRRRVSYEGGAWLETLTAGDVVAITDPEVHLDEEVALVMEVTPTGDTVDVELLLLDHPRNRERLTG